MKTIHPGLRLLLGTALSFGLFLTLFGVTFAEPLHAKVIASNPAAGATITQAPTTISVTTAENMKPDAASSNLFVYGPSGDLISQGNAKVALNNPKQMSVGIKPEKNGVYVVQWKTVSADDGDPDQGAFTFTVGAAATTTTHTTPAQTTTTTTGNTSTGGTSWLIAAAIAVVTLLIGLGVGLAIGRARPQQQSQVVSTPEDEYNKIS
jgi:methionine-rich copper-binding protein CopC